MLKIEVMPDSVRQLTSKAGRAFCLQAGWVHVLTAEGKPQPHPVRAEWFVDSPDKAAADAAPITDSGISIGASNAPATNIPGLLA